MRRVSRVAAFRGLHHLICLIKVIVERRYILNAKRSPLLIRRVKNSNHYASGKSWTSNMPIPEQILRDFRDPSGRLSVFASDNSKERLDLIILALALGREHIQSFDYVNITTARLQRQTCGRFRFSYGTTPVVEPNAHHYEGYDLNDGHRADMAVAVGNSCGNIRMPRNSVLALIAEAYRQGAFGLGDIPKGTMKKDVADLLHARAIVVRGSEPLG